LTGILIMVDRHNDCRNCRMSKFFDDCSHRNIERIERLEYNRQCPFWFPIDTEINTNFLNEVTRKFNIYYKIKT
jgi:hypothetical protein